jgi:hypothetical protein
MRVENRDGKTKVTLVDKTVTFSDDSMIPMSLKKEIIRKFKSKIITFIGENVERRRQLPPMNPKYEYSVQDDRLPTERVFKERPNCFLKRGGKFVEAVAVINGGEIMIEPLVKDSACYLIEIGKVPTTMWTSNRVDIRKVPHKRLYHRGKSLQKIKSFYKGGKK